MAKKKKKRVAKKPPKGNFHRGDLLWLPDNLTVTPTFMVTIPHKPFTLNDMIYMKGNQGDKWAQAQWSEFKEGWERVIRHYWVTQAHELGLKPPRIPDTEYVVRYTYVCKDKRSDPSNIHAAFEKVALDALDQAGAIPSDRFAHHRGSSYRAVHGEKWGTVITISVYEELSDSQ